MISINCDIGERGPDHPVDIELMSYIQIINLACGSHAGDYAVISDKGDTTIKQRVPIKADSICIHSDSNIALELAESLAGLRNSRD